MKSAFLIPLIVFFLNTAFACETGEITFEKNNLCAQVQWITGPSFDQFNSLQVNLSEGTDLKLNVLPWMVMSEGHEHGSRPVKVTAISPRNFLVEKIYFMGGMMGQWYLRFQLVNDKKEVVEEVKTLIGL